MNLDEAYVYFLDNFNIPAHKTVPACKDGRHCDHYIPMGLASLWGDGCSLEYCDNYVRAVRLPVPFEKVKEDIRKLYEEWRIEKYGTLRGVGKDWRTSKGDINMLIELVNEKYRITPKVRAIFGLTGWE